MPDNASNEQPPKPRREQEPPVTETTAKALRNRLKELLKNGHRIDHPEGPPMPHTTFDNYFRLDKTTKVHVHEMEFSETEEEKNIFSATLTEEKKADDGTGFVIDTGYTIKPDRQRRLSVFTDVLSYSQKEHEDYHEKSDDERWEEIRTAAYRDNENLDIEDEFFSDPITEDAAQKLIQKLSTIDPIENQISLDDYEDVGF